MRVSGRGLVQAAFDRYEAEVRPPLSCSRDTKRNGDVDGRTGSGDRTCGADCGSGQTEMALRNEYGLIHCNCDRVSLVICVWLL